MQDGVLLILMVVSAWFVAQSLKFLLHSGTDGERWWWRTGGFPSSHTAPAAALCCGVFLIQGFSVLFVVTLVFLIAIIRDAVGVRFATGENAKLFRTYLGKNVLAKQVVVEEGHTLLQVCGGLFFGISVALIIFGVLG